MDLPAWTHLEVSRLAARWLLLRRFSTCATWEVGPDPRKERLLSETPSRFDAMGVRSSAQPRGRNGRIDIVEVKVSRADLLADLREKKSHKYFNFGSHVWLMLTQSLADELVSPNPPTDADGWRARSVDWEDRCRSRFAELGWPEAGGLLVIDRDRRGRPRVSELRLARRQSQCQPTDADLAKAVERIAVRYSHRMLDPVDAGDVRLGGQDVVLGEMLPDDSTEEVLHRMFE